MSKTLFVANFPDHVGTKDLEKLFTRFGRVCDVTIWINLQTGDSLGWGFIEMDDDYEAECAIAGLDGRQWRGQRLKVSEARPRATRKQGN